MNSDAAPKPVVCLERAELERIESARHVPPINDRALINTHTLRRVHRWDREDPGERERNFCTGHDA